MRGALSVVGLVLALGIAAPSVAVAQDPDLAGEWHLDSIAGGTTPDTSGHGDNGHALGARRPRLPTAASVRVSTSPPRPTTSAPATPPPSSRATSRFSRGSARRAPRATWRPSSPRAPNPAARLPRTRCTPEARRTTRRPRGGAVLRVRARQPSEHDAPYTPGTAHDLGRPLARDSRHLRRERGAPLRRRPGGRQLP